MCIELFHPLKTTNKNELNTFDSKRNIIQNNIQTNKSY